jgi:hypothetical protein
MRQTRTRRRRRRLQQQQQRRAAVHTTLKIIGLLPCSWPKIDLAQRKSASHVRVCVCACVRVYARALLTDPWFCYTLTHSCGSVNNSTDLNSLLVPKEIRRESHRHPVLTSLLPNMPTRQVPYRYARTHTLTLMNNALNT